MIWLLGLGGLYAAWKLRAGRQLEKKRNPDHASEFNRRAFESVLDKGRDDLELVLNQTLPQSEKRRLRAEHRSFGMRQAELEHRSVLRLASRQMALTQAARSPYA
jgi:hypothetical protein